MPVVLYLPQRLTPSEITFAQAIADGVECTVILGLTGVQRADTAVRESVAAVTGQPLPDGPRPPTAHRILHHSDSDDEVRGIVHEVLDALADTPAHRIAILYARARPYARLLHEQLTAAGVLVNGPGVVAVDERAISRGLLGVLALGPDLPRAEAFRALSEAPTRDPATGRRIPMARWERISRMAGVVGGPDWDRRLRRFADDQRAAAEESDRTRRVRRSDSGSGRCDGAVRVRRRARSTARRRRRAHLLARAGELGARTVPRPVRRPGRSRAAAAGGAVCGRGDRADLAAPGRPGHPRDPCGPRAARRGPDRGAPLGAATGRPVRRGSLRRADLRSDRNVADTVFVLGLSEDTYPGATHVEALLPDRIRDAVPGLPGSRDRLDAKHRELLAALMSADQVVASFARGDLRRNTLRLPSRWLLPTLRELTGDQRLAATRWSDASSPKVVGGPSYAATLGRSPRPATGQEWRVRAVATGARADPVTAAAVDLLAARAGNEFTRYDGNLTAAAGLPDPGADGVLLSATRLESYAVCPHAYFVQRLLRRAAAGAAGGDHRHLPAGHRQPDARGDGRVRPARGGTDYPATGSPGRRRNATSLLEIGAAKAVEFETRGVTGHPLLWTAERTRILADLRPHARRRQRSGGRGWTPGWWPAN